MTNQFYTFQIDLLIVTKYLAIILEVKNLKGTLYFEPHFNQMIQTYQGKEKGYQNPIDQVKWQKLQLKQWFIEQHFNDIHIESQVVIAFPSTIIKTDHEIRNYIKEKVCHAYQLPHHLHEIEQRYSKDEIPLKTQKKLGRLLLKSHTPHFSNINERFSISTNDVIRGVQCPACLAYSMIKIRGKWQCPHCSFQSKDAFQQGILDYFLLIDSKITNQECRDFLRIQSKHVTTALLQEMKLPFSGTTRGRIYQHPFK